MKPRMKSALVEIQNASLTFPMSYEVSLSIQSWLSELHKRTRQNWKPKSFTALDNITLSAHSGEVIGIIGGNGAGKTTLLRLIAGIYKPDSGEIKVTRTVTAILGVGVGFNTALSGANNIRLGALLMGYSKVWIEERLQDIHEFSGLGEFFHVPIKYYSTGMISRLGFSLAIFSEPEILLIDESLSVGDLDFKDKATKAMERLRMRSDLQFIVTHDLATVTKLCSRALMLNRGKLVFDGSPDRAVRFYTKLT